ncbi:MAG TPA: cupin domain-containing protein [Candidatus Polarisedimenticolia bacterium]|nr:cupin domain-containing protein [Candidatus Polarisedimenticolia bacterium]
MSEPRIVNVGDLPWTEWSAGPGMNVEIRDPARKLESHLCGLRLYRLAPGKQATRLHRHLLQEEMFLILKGSGTLRHGDREVPVRQGDFILYPAGDPTPHTFTNPGTEPLEYLATGNRVSYEVCEYPEDGTVFVEAIGKSFRSKDAVDVAKKMEEYFKAGR